MYYELKTYRVVCDRCGASITTNTIFEIDAHLRFLGWRIGGCTAGYSVCDICVKKEERP